MIRARHALGLLAAVVLYQPPTDAPVSDPFRPPPKPWMAGNRGIEYATSPGSPVRAIGGGTVTFAGPVAGRNVVVVLHPDGLRSSYTHLGAIGVRPGQPVGPGAVVGQATDRLHLGVRRGSTYIDPAQLWGRRGDRGRPVLVPTAHPTSRAPPPLGAAAPGHYTRTSAHHPVGRRPTRTPPPNGRCREPPAVLRRCASKKPLERSGS